MNSFYKNLARIKGRPNKAEHDREHELKMISGIGTDYYKPYGYLKHLRVSGFELPHMLPQQALEILTTGDCATDK